jgi:hypothetical protein
MRAIGSISIFILLIGFTPSCTNQECEEDLSFRTKFYILIDSVEEACEKGKDNRNVIGLDGEEQVQNIDCLSEITKTSSNVTYGYYFGYRNYETFLEDKSQWIEWYKTNSCNSTIIKEAIIELDRCLNSE